jgi:hypothetical protein
MARGNWATSHYVLVPTNIQTDPRMLVFAKLLKLDTTVAIGLAIQFWSWAVERADSDGIIPVCPDAITQAIQWPKTEVLAAAKQAGLWEDHDGQVRVCNWKEVAAHRLNREYLTKYKRESRRAAK